MSGIDFPSLPADVTGALLASTSGATAKSPRAGQRTEQAAKDFEAVLLNKLLEEMDRTIDRSGLLDSGASRQVQSLFWHYLSQEVADQGGLGLWKQLHRQLEAHSGGEAGTAAAVDTERPE